MKNKKVKVILFILFIVLISFSQGWARIKAPKKDIDYIILFSIIIGSSFIVYYNIKKIFPKKKKIKNKYNKGSNKDTPQ